MNHPSITASITVPGQSTPLERSLHEVEFTIPLRVSEGGGLEHANSAAVMIGVQWSGDQVVDARIKHAVAVANRLLTQHDEIQSWKMGYDAGKQSADERIDMLRDALNAFDR